MCGRIISLLLFASLMVSFTVPVPAHAQRANDKGGQNATQGPRKHLGNIVFAGLAGAVLGLSTLSFYGRPQDRLSNIAVGFAIGVIGGTMFSTYKAAAEPREFYGLTDPMLRFEQARYTPSASYVFEF